MFTLQHNYKINLNKKEIRLMLKRWNFPLKEKDSLILLYNTEAKNYFPLINLNISNLQIMLFKIKEQIYSTSI